MKLALSGIQNFNIISDQSAYQGSRHAAFAFAKAGVDADDTVIMLAWNVVGLKPANIYNPSRRHLRVLHVLSVKVVIALDFALLRQVGFGQAIRLKQFALTKLVSFAVAKLIFLRFSRFGWD